MYAWTSFTPKVPRRRYGQRKLLIHSDLVLLICVRFDNLCSGGYNPTFFKTNPKARVYEEWRVESLVWPLSSGLAFGPSHRRDQYAVQHNLHPPRSAFLATDARSMTRRS